MIKRLLRFMSVSALLTCTNSCQVEDYFLSDMNTDDLQLATSVSSPIGSSNISIADLLKKQEVKGLDYDSTGLVVFSYDTTQHYDISALKINGFSSITSVSAYTLLGNQLDGLGISESQFSSTYTSKDQAVSVSIPQYTKMKFTTALSVKDLLGSTEGQRIDSIIFKKGLISVSLTSDISNLLENSSASIALRTKGESISATNQNANTGFTMFLDNTMLYINDADSLYFDCTLTANRRFTTQIYNKNFLSVRLSAYETELKLDKAWGVFNNIEPVVGSNIIDVDLYGQNGKGESDFNLQLVDPKININATTNVGVPFQIGISKLEAKNDQTSMQAIFANGKKTYTKDLGYAKTIGQNVDALTETFDKDNGKVDELVNLLPNAIDLNYTFNAKECDLNGQTNYFVTSDAYIDLNCNVELPAYLKKGSYIVVLDTIKDIEIGDDLGEKYTFETAKITAEIENSLPFDANIEFYFMQEDESGNIDIIEDKNIQKKLSIESGTVDSNTSKVTSASKTEQDLMFTDADIPSLKKAKHLLITYKVAVDDFEKVKVTKENALHVKLKAYVKGNVYINKL